jgi:nucleoside-diphosphate-sugar epimerase
MKILVTGADRPLGGAIRQHLAQTHDVVEAVRGAAAIVHAAHFEPGTQPDTVEIEAASRGSYVLARAAREAGVGRIIVVSTLTIYDAYPANYLIDEMWEPRPQPVAAQLAPFLAEQSVREFAREGGICGICLRFLPIGNDPERGTRLADALQAVDRALVLPFKVPGYRWHVFHIANSPRYLMRDAIRQLGFVPPEAR